MSKATKTAPKFANETQERAFWEKHDSADYLDWSAARAVVLPNLKPTTKTLSLRLPQHMLRDIGLNASEAEAEVSKPFWRG